MPKIYILGTVGSGKTTLARKLSKELNVSHYELDNVVWNYSPSGDIRRSNEEISKLFQDIINNDNWIIEDVGRDIFDKGLIKADTIIFLNISKFTLHRRILFRWTKQKLRIEKSRYKVDFKMLKQMYKWADKDLKNSKLSKIMIYENKVVILDEKNIHKYIYVQSD